MRRRKQKRDRPRAHSMKMNEMAKEVISSSDIGLSAYLDSKEYRETLKTRPKTREDCRGHEGPCPWVSCRFNLYLDINPETRTIKLNFPELELWELKHTCALDVADEGKLNLEDVGEILNLTRERVRQIEVGALQKLKLSVLVDELAEGFRNK